MKLRVGVQPPRDDEASSKADISGCHSTSNKSVATAKTFRTRCCLLYRPSESTSQANALPRPYPHPTTLGCNLNHVTATGSGADKTLLTSVNSKMSRKFAGKYRQV
jgi:hypothetical protein